MNSILQESQILGPISNWSLYTQSENLYIEKHEHYQKRSSRNRYTILTSQGPLSLTVPLRKGKNNQKPITDVQIAYDEPWIENHCHTIRSAYGKSAFFEYYYPEYKSILERKYTYLFELNNAFLLWALAKTKLNIKVFNTTDYIKDANGFQDFRNKKVSHKIVPYPQVWEEKLDFVSNLSILDLLFCQGNYALYTLNDMQK
jgi:hypothetical protein